VKKLLLALIAWTAVVHAEPRQPEQLEHRPSGFWTSNRPAEHGAYRWRLLGLGIALAGTMGVITARILRSASEDRARRK
jgi:hypothetical protein